MKRQLLALGTSAILLAAPATATAALELGDDPFQSLPTGATVACPVAGACTIAIDQHANESLRAPFFGTTEHGVITRWAVSGSGGEVRLRRLSGDLTTALGASAPGQLPAALGPVAFTTELPVRAGDAIGIDLSAGAEIAGEPALVPGTDTLVGWEPPLVDGGARTPDFGEDGSLYLAVWVEPDVNQDGRGDESHPPPPPPPICDCLPPDPPRIDPPRVDPPRTDVPRTDVPRADPYAGLPKAGPSVTIAGRAAASKRGVASFTLTNPYGFKVSGTVKVKRGRRAVGSAKVSLAANGSRVVRVKLDRAGKRTVARGGKLKLTLAATLRAPVGRARTTTKPVTVASGVKPTPPPTRRGPTTPPTRGDDAPGFDGTYRAPDGLVMVVQDGRVLSFSGSITTYCTKAAKQRLVSYGMFGDDPDPTVAADGSFSYEATRGYGFIKLKYEGRIVGDRASGRLVVEDTSPLLGTGRFEFDYCFAGADWSVSK